MVGSAGPWRAPRAQAAREPSPGIIPLRRIAAGGMGEIYLARQTFDPCLPSLVAVKRLREHCAEDPRIVSMFREEAHISCALDHPNVVQVWDLGEDEEGFFLLMEHVPGLSLHSCLRQGGPLPLALVLRIASDVASGLHHAHEKRDRRGNPANLVHRDVSPGNVLLSFSGEVKVADFGIAKFKWSRNKTEAGVIKGKYTYLSPEQARGEPVDRRADVFGMGLLIFEMVTGRRAYQGEELDVIDRAARGAVEPLDESFPHELRPVVQRALAREPGDRYPTCAALREHLLIVADRSGGLAPSSAVGELVSRLAGQRDDSESSDPYKEGSISAAHGEVQPTTSLIRHRFVRWTPVAALGAAVVAAVLVATWPVSSTIRDEQRHELGALATSSTLHQGTAAAQPHVERMAPLSAPASGFSRHAKPSATPANKAPAKPRRHRAARRTRSPRRARVPDGALPRVLSLSTDPPCEVLLGSRVLGTTPLRAALPPGKQQVLLTFRNRDLGLLVRRKVTRRQASRSLRFVFEKGRIVFAVKPGKLIRLDGRTLGMSPVPPAVVYEGTHTVMLTSPFRYVTKHHKVRVKAAQTATVSDT